MTTYVALQVAPESDEYKLIKAKFDATMGGTAIKSIRRIQNLELWDEFLRCMELHTKTTVLQWQKSIS